MSFPNRASAAADFPAPQFVNTNGIRMAVYEQGTGPAVVFSHGFPGLAYTWRHQMEAFSAAGFRAIAPDQRGFGKTDRPEAVEAYDIRQLTADLAGMLDALEIEKAVFCGFDWGGTVVWHMPLFYPDRVAGIITANSPLRNRPPLAPLPLMKRMRGEDDYMIRFQVRDEPEKILSKNVANTIRVFTTDYSKEAARKRPEGEPNFKFDPLGFLERGEFSGEPYLSEDELAVFVSAYEETGFSGGLNWYRNIDRNWEITADVEFMVDAPALYIGNNKNPQGPKSMLPDVENHYYDDWRHWSLELRADEFNAIALEWLRRRIASSSAE